MNRLICGCARNHTTQPYGKPARTKQPDTLARGHPRATIRNKHLPRITLLATGNPTEEQTQPFHSAPIQGHSEHGAANDAGAIGDSAAAAAVVDAAVGNSTAAAKAAVDAAVDIVALVGGGAAAVGAATAAAAVGHVADNDGDSAPDTAAADNASFAVVDH